MKILQKYFYGTGRRKTACARVFLEDGNGDIFVNKKKFNNYFNSYIQKRLLLIIDLIEINNKYNLYITVKGGGISGQIEAIKHGLARALLKYNILFKKKLKSLHLLTRDSRQVERKKVGLKKSRKSPQYSKR